MAVPHLSGGQDGDGVASTDVLQLVREHVSGGTPKTRFSSVRISIRTSNYNSLVLYSFSLHLRKAP